ncbi:CoA pyrophosphatase [Tistlia consotensis]|uniref:CoA pyrophosphatase n=1 Tax=Tistlia consotensis TaxID=1321365 RepID=UPI001F3AA4CD|nr:CoA pyrophosphatase [Tistlia consotensis]
MARRLAGAVPGRRAAPGEQFPADASAVPRGDHELNPQLYEPGRALRHAAVLVPLIERDRGLHVVLTRRSQHLADHKGQIAFPGGRIDPTDPSPRDAALREAEEEIALARDRVEVVGELDTYVTRTGYQIHPFVGLLRPPVVLVPEPLEVDEIFEVPLGFILAPGSRQTHSRELLGTTRHYYVYPYGDYYIWGATAGMLNNLAELLNGA